MSLYAFTSESSDFSLFLSAGCSWNFMLHRSLCVYHIWWLWPLLWRRVHVDSSCCNHSCWNSSLHHRFDWLLRNNTWKLLWLGNGEYAKKKSGFMPIVGNCRKHVKKCQGRLVIYFKKICNIDISDDKVKNTEWCFSCLQFAGSTINIVSKGRAFSQYWH